MAKLVAGVRGIIKKASADQITTQAAAVAYNFFFSLFPLIAALFALTGIVGGERAFYAIMSGIERAVPYETAALLSRYVAEVTNHSRPAILSVSVVLLLWSAAGGVMALMGGLNTVYGVQERRGFWKPRAIALGMLVVCAILFIAGAIGILVGPAIARAIHLGLAWEILRWPVGFLLVVLVLWLLYSVLPDRSQRHAKREVLVGAVVGAALWLLVTFLFRLYVGHFGSYDVAYGALGAVAVLLVWLYLTALAILFGGEVATMLEAKRRGR